MSDLLTLFSPETLEEHFSSEWLPGFISVNDFTEELIDLLEKKNKRENKPREIKKIIKEKTCTNCNRSFPKTEEFFYYSGNKRLSNCKECHYKITRERLVVKVKIKQDFKELINKYYKRINSEGSVSQTHKAAESLTLIKVIEDIEKIIGKSDTNEVYNRLSGQERGE